ncbi:hypothetical protein ACQJBY_059224 [Aegilops geniculata]
MLFPLSSPSWRSSAVETVVVTFCLLPSCLGFHGDEDVQCSRIPRAVHPAPSCGSSTATGDSLPSLTSLHNRRAALLSLMGARLTGLLLVRATTTSHPDDNYLCFEMPHLDLSLGVCGAVQPQSTCSSVLV